ncbi:MAG: hypothetical protein V7629_19660 [Motiliproteus sp.]
MSDNDLLDDYLNGDSDLSSLYAASQTEDASPSAATDSAILAAAKKELGTGPVATPRPSIKRWAVPFSAAATVLLTTTLFLTNQHEIESIPTPEAFAPELPALDGAPMRQSSQDVSIQSDTDTLKTEAAKADVLERLDLKKTQSSQPAVAVPSSPAESAPAKLGKALRKAKESREEMRYRANQAPPQPAIRAVEESQSGLTSGFTTPAEPLKRREDEQFSDAPATAGRLVEHKDLIGFRESPTQWLQVIRDSLAAGDLNTAKDEMAAFVIRYPDFLIPTDLKVLIRQ